MHRFAHAASSQHGDWRAAAKGFEQHITSLVAVLCLTP